MQSLKFLILLFILLLSPVLFSQEDEENIFLNGHLTTGGGYDSYIPSLGKDTTARIGSKEIITDIGISLDIYDFFIGTSLYLNGLTAEKWSHSLLTGSVSAGWFSSIDDYDITVNLFGSCSGYDFDEFRAYYTDVSADAEIFYNHAENMGFYFNLFGGYTYGLDSSLKYLKGPYTGFETGEYFYFGSYDSYIRINGRVNFSFFGNVTEDNYPYLGEAGITSLSASGQGVDTLIGLRNRFNYKNTYLLFSPGYRFSTMFEKDKWELADRFVLKRRVDHTILFELEPGWKTDDTLTIYIYYLFEKNFSTIGKTDYSDENYVRHQVRLVFNFDF